MNKTKKLICLAVLTVLLLSSVIALAACGGNAKETIESYMPSFSGKSVKDDFELPRTIGDNVKVSWKSSNPNAIEVVTRGKNETYLAKVKLGDTVQTVTLTVSAGGASKDFTVNVQALNATLIASEYEFKYNRAEVSEDFDLPATAEVRGVTAQITWSVDPKYSEYIEVKDGRCVITLPSETTRVEINATFSYNNTTATMPYTFYVAQPKSHRESVNAWYQSANVTLAEVRGYVVGIATAYNDNFNNISMYIVDEDMCSGYYLFRCKGSAEDAAKLAVGVHVTITSLTSSDFNGLMESTSDCTFVVDDDLPAKDVKDLVYALDNDATSGSPALKWHTGSLASLTNWTVKSVESKFSSKSGTMMTITKDGADIAIAYNNYMEGFYTSTDSQPAATQFNLSRFKVGDTVSVTGIVSYHSGFQVMPRNADDIKTGTADTNPTDGSKVKAAITEVEGKLTGIDGLITTARTFDLPTASNGVNITYTKTYNGSSVSIEGGKITVTPQDKLQIITVEAEYKIGNYTTWTYFTLRSQNLDDQGKVNYVKGLFEAAILDEVTKTGDVTLPSNNEFDGLTVSWSVKGGAPDWLAISGNKLTINQLPTEDTTLTLVADISLNGKTAQAEVTLQVAAGSGVTFKAIDAPVEGTELLFAMYPSDLGRWYYATGKNKGNYLETTTDPEQAGKFVITKQGDDTYIIKTGDKFLEVVKNGTYYNAQVVDKQTEGQVWKWDADNKIFYMEHGTEKYYMGTYAQSGKSSFETISASKWSYLATATGKAQFGTLTTESVSYKLDPITEPKAGTYKFGLFQGNDSINKWLYATGKISTNKSGDFGATSDNKDDAADFEIKEVTGGYTIQLVSTGKFLELNSEHRWCYVDASTQPWVWNTEAKVFTFTVSDTVYYLGTYGTFETISASTIDRITGSNLGVSGQYIAHFGQIVEDTSSTTPGGGDEPTPPTPDTTNYGTAEAPISVAEALAIAEEQCPSKDNFSKQRVFVTGIVVTQPDNSGSDIKEFTLRDIDDPNKTILVYRMNKKSGVDDPDQNDTVILSGFIKNQYGTTLEFASNSSEYVELLNNTRGKSTVTLGDHGDSTVTGIPETAQNNGSEITLNVTANAGKQVAFVKVNGAILAAQADGSYKFTLHGNTEIIVETANEGEVLPVLATTIKFGSSGDMKEGASVDLVEFEKDGFNVKCEKGSSKTNCRFSDADEYRMYQDSKFTVSSDKAFVKLVFTAGSESYAEVLQTSIENAELANVTVKLDGVYVTVTFDEPVTSFGAITLSAQSRVTSLEIWTLPEA